MRKGHSGVGLENDTHESFNNGAWHPRDRSIVTGKAPVAEKPDTGNRQLTNGGNLICERKNNLS